MSDDIVGHKTFSDGHGGFRHEPLTRSEADALWERAEQLQRDRAASMPTEQDAINAMFQAWLRLKELGWNDAVYCPKDGTTFKAIEPGSSGIHDCVYHGEWPSGGWWVQAEGDLWPSRPCLYKAISSAALHQPKEE